MNAYQWMTAYLDTLGCLPKGGRLRQCVAHPDSSPSMSVRAYADGSVSLRCFAGCEQAAIYAALHVTSLRLRKPAPVSPAEYAAMTGAAPRFPPLVQKRGDPEKRGYRIEAIHRYGPAQLVRFRHPVTRDKELVWETVRDGRAIPGLFGVSLLDLGLYREREVRQGMALGEPVVLVESESTVDAIKGSWVTTWAGSASTPNIGRLVEVLGAYDRLVTIPDNDTAGLACLARLERAGLARNVVLPEPGEDAKDLYLRLGHRRFTLTCANSLAGTSLVAA